MDDLALKNALGRKGELTAEIDELQKKLAELKRDLARTDQFISDWNVFAGLAKAESAPAATSSKAQNPERALVGDRAATALQVAGHPLSRSELFDALSKMGLSITGKDPQMVLSTMMWRMQDRFVRIPGFGYWFRDQPCQVAGYEPGDIPDSRDKKHDELQNELEKLI